MEINLSFCYIYSCLVFAIMICYIFYKRSIFRLNFFVFLWWSISSLASCVFCYIYQPLLEGLSPQALMYFYACMLMMAYSIYGFDEAKIRITNINRYNSFICKFSIILGVLSIPPLIENLFFVFSHSNLNFVVDQHDMLNSGDIKSHLSFISEKLHNFCAHFADIYGVLFCTIILNAQRNKFALIMIAIATTEQVLNSVSNGSRGYIAYLALMFAISYSIFYRHYPVKFKKTVNKYIGVICFAIVSVLLLVSSARVKTVDTTYLNVTSEQAELASYSLYIGEGPIRFSSFAWDKLKDYTYGHSLFDIFASPLDGNYFQNSSERRNWVAWQTGLKYPQVFYGLPGFAYIDFGFWGGMIIIILFCVLFKYILNKQNNYDLIRIFGSVIVYKICFFLTMFFPYSYSKMLDVIYVSIFLVVLRSHSQVHLRYKTKFK